MSDMHLNNPTFRKMLADMKKGITKYETGADTYLRVSDSTYDAIPHPNLFIGRTDTVPCNHYWPDMAHPLKVLSSDFSAEGGALHTHPYVKGNAYPPECVGGLKSQVVVSVLEGPSPDDMGTIQGSALLGWIVAKDGYVYRYTGVVGQSKRWQFDSDASGVSSCLLPDSHWTG